jgi:hypothetical protein
LAAWGPTRPKKTAAPREKRGGAAAFYRRPAREEERPACNFEQDPREEEWVCSVISPALGRRSGRGRSRLGADLARNIGCGGPREEERGRRCSDRLREEEEPLELFGPFWTEFGAATSGRRREAAAFPIGPREEEGTCRIT